MVKFAEEDVHYASIKTFLLDTRNVDHITPDRRLRPNISAKALSSQEIQMQGDQPDEATVIEGMVT